MDDGSRWDASTGPESGAEHEPIPLWRRRSGLWIAAAAAVVLLGAGAAGIAAAASSSTEPTGPPSLSRNASPSPTMTANTPTPSVTPTPSATQAPTLVYIDELELASRSVDDAIDVLVKNRLGYTVVTGGPAPTLSAEGTVAAAEPLGYQSPGTTIALTVYEDVEPLHMPWGDLFFEVDGAFPPSPQAPGLVVDVLVPGLTYPCPSWAPTFSHLTVTATDGTFANGQRTIDTTQSPIPFTIGTGVGQQWMRWTATCSGPEGDHVTPPNQQGFQVG